jgi:SET domain-containing protein
MRDKKLVRYSSMKLKRPISRPALRVGRSRAGLGLFATATIPQGSFIEYTGPILTSAEADKKGGKYLFEISARTIIDGTGRANLARYINHACKNNCIPEIRGRKVFIVTKRAIQPGEELTYHYGKEYFDEFIKPYGCRCASCLAKK